MKLNLLVLATAMALIAMPAAGADVPVKPPTATEQKQDAAEAGQKGFRIILSPRSRYHRYPSGYHRYPRNYPRYYAPSRGINFRLTIGGSSGRNRVYLTPGYSHRYNRYRYYDPYDHYYPHVYPRSQRHRIYVPARGVAIPGQVDFYPLDPPNRLRYKDW